MAERTAFRTTSNIFIYVCLVVIGPLPSAVSLTLPLRFIVLIQYTDNTFSFVPDGSEHRCSRHVGNFVCTFLSNAGLIRPAHFCYSQPHSTQTTCSVSSEEVSICVAAQTQLLEKDQLAAGLFFGLKDMLPIMHNLFFSAYLVDKYYM